MKNRDNSGPLAESLISARMWAYENLAGKQVYHKDIQAFINFNIDGIKHAIYSKTYKEKIEMIYQAINILENSTLFSIEKDKKERPEIKAIYRFVSQWQYDDREYFVYIVVRQNVIGNFYYDHGIIKEKP
jgi:hypothetical protein